MVGGGSHRDDAFPVHGWRREGATIRCSALPARMRVVWRKRSGCAVKMAEGGNAEDSSSSCDALPEGESLMAAAVIEQLRLDAVQSEPENADEEIVQTPPPSPTDKNSVVKPSFFSIAQVSTKLGELWSSAREQIFGEDYWIPSDPNEIAVFPNELLRAHKGSLKNRPGTPLHHVVLILDDAPGHSFSLYRSSELDEAVDLCRRCIEYRKKDSRRSIAELVAKLKQYPLWRLVHIAIACNRDDLFSDESIEFIDKNLGSFSCMMRMACHPEGKYPLLLSIEMNRPKIARRLLELKIDPGLRDVHGNNVFHYASLTSVQMLELLWEFPDTHGMLNMTNNEGYAPVVLAIRNANPRCLSTLLGFGAELSIRVAGKNPLFEAMTSKGKSTELIKALLDASPNLLHEKDEATGNTALHVAQYKTPLMGLLLLKHKELDLNQPNNAGQTALHLYTHRGDVGLIVTLASYRCDVNAKDANGNTALHIAVSKKDLTVTRLLLCLGADPNITNNHDDTARHLAARLKQNDLLHSLVISGALRCEPFKLGCGSGCVSDRVASLRSTQPSMDDASPRTTAAIAAAENGPEEFEVEHPIVNYAQKGMLRRLEEMERQKKVNSQYVNMLSMDGGGIRGLVIIMMLMEIEKEMGEPVFPYFDWVAGTSTGALVAAALAQGKTVRDCQHIYLRFKDMVFDGWSRTYSSTVLESFMKEQVGLGTLKSVPSPRLMISTVKADFFPVKLEFMRNYRLPLSDEDNEKLGFTDPESIPIWKALRRTSAAPVFFSPVDDKYIDGGIIANNPAIDLLAEVQLFNATSSYVGREEKVEIGCLLSLGTGAIPASPMDHLNVEVTNPISSAFAFKNLSLILVDQVTATEGAPVDRSRSFCNSIGVPFFRLSAPLHKDINLATRDDMEVAGMMWDCVEYAHLCRPYIRRLCRLLKLVGKRENRSHLFHNGTSKTQDSQTQTSPPETPSDDFSLSGFSTP